MLLNTVARMAKSVDAGDLKSPGSNTVPVQVRLRAPCSLVLTERMAPSPSGKAGACKASIPSSNLGGASNNNNKTTRPYTWTDGRAWLNAPVLKTGEGHTS